MNPSVLVVDDEQSICTALQRTFRREKFQVFSANSGKQALEIINKNSIDVIVSDQKMPGMTGTQLLGIVKDSHPDIGRIILSGHSDVHDLTDAINEANINQFLPKPWQNDRLISTVKNAIKKTVLKTYQSPYTVPSLTDEGYREHLGNDIKNDHLMLENNIYQSRTGNNLSLRNYSIEWPAYPHFNHYGITNMANQSGNLNALFTWYLIKINESLMTDDDTPEYKVVDVFFEKFSKNTLMRQLLVKLLSTKSNLVFRVPFELLQNDYLYDLLGGIRQSNHSLMLNLGQRVIDINALESTSPEYIEMDNKHSSINNNLLTEKRLTMLKNAQNMGIKTILSKPHYTTQRNYALNMGFDYF